MDGREIPFKLSNAAVSAQSKRDGSVPLLMPPGTTAVIDDEGYKRLALNSTYTNTVNASNGSYIQYSSLAYSPILLASQSQQTFTFKLGADVQFGSVSWLRGFSAPVGLISEQQSWVDELILLAKHDRDPYARCAWILESLCT